MQLKHTKHIKNHTLNRIIGDLKVLHQERRNKLTEAGLDKKGLEEAMKSLAQQLVQHVKLLEELKQSEQSDQTKEV